MAALLGADLEPVLDICAEAQQDQIVTVANDNSVGQIVISGHREAVDRAIALAAERGIKKAIMLPVSAPFHCPLMAPAALVMKDALAKVDGIGEVTVTMTFDPPWTPDRMSEEAKLELNMY